MQGQTIIQHTILSHNMIEKDRRTSISYAFVSIYAQSAAKKASILSAHLAMAGSQAKLVAEFLLLIKL